MTSRQSDPVSIPWGYGRDRVTAMVVDPERLFVYWEVTDEGIARARAVLPEAAREAARLALRVYDVTGRLFDGTNAHAHDDQPVERQHRQWSFRVGRPGSAAIVEVGLLAASGRFARIARSRRAEFPRRQPSSDSAEWRTIRADDWRAGALDATPGVAAGDPRPCGSRPGPEAAAESRRLGGASEWPWTPGEGG